MRAWLRAPRLPFVRCHLQVEAVVDVDAVLLGHRVRDEDSERLQQRQLLLLGLGPGLAILELLDEAVEELAAEDRLEGDRAVEHVPELRHLRPEGQVLSQGRDLERHVLRAAPVVIAVDRVHELVVEIPLLDREQRLLIVEHPLADSVLRHRAAVLDDDAPEEAVLQVTDDRGRGAAQRPELGALAELREEARARFVFLRARQR